MKKLLAIVISMAMLVAMMPMGVFAGDETSGDGSSGGTPVTEKVAKIGDTEYETLAAAVAAVHQKKGEDRKKTYTIELQSNASGGGIPVGYDSIKNDTTTGENPVNIVIDLKGYTYTVTTPTVGSAGTETNGFQMLKGSNVTLKDGTISTKLSGGILLQNYCNLTLDNVSVEAPNEAYVMSNNFGDVVIKNKTNITAGNNKVAFDLWYGMSDNYANGINVTFDESFTGNVTGKIEYGAANETSGTDWKTKARLDIKGNGTFDSTFNGTSHDALKNAGITISGGAFSDEKVFDYLGNDANIKLTKNVTLEKGISIPADKKLVLDLGTNTISCNGTLVFDIYGDLELKNGTVKTTGFEDAGATIWLNKTAKLKVDKDATVVAEDTQNGKSSFAIGFWSDCTAANLVINGKLVGENGATVNGSITTAGNNVIVGKDAIIDVSGIGLYLAGVANTTVNCAKIKGGTTAIEIRAGELTVNGGEFESTATEYKCDPNDNGTTTEGAALAIAQHTTKKDIKVTVNDGIFKGIKALNESNPQANDPAPQVTLAVKDGTFDGEVSVTDASKFITGGTFSKSPKQYTAESYMVYKYSDAKYEVLAGDAEKPAGYTWTPAGEGVTDCDFIGTAIPYTPSTPADNVTNNTTDKNTTADLTPAVKDNKAETTVDAKTADKIVDKAVANKSTEVIVDATGNNTVASSEVAIPEKTVKELAEKTDAKLVIKTDNGKVDLDKAAVKAVADQAGTTGTVKLIVETVKTDADICHVNLKLVTSNGAVTDFKGGNVKVTINLTKELAAKELVCVYIDDNGIYTLVEGVLNADGTYTFTTGHFSEYAVMAKAEADKKIAEQLDTMIKDVNLKVRTSKTAKKNIKAVVSGDVKAITDAGYTVKYKFYRSEKKASKYVAKATKAGKTYVNTAGKKGTKYYYKAKALVYDGDKLVGQTVLKQCKYGARTWSK